MNWHAEPYWQWWYSQPEIVALMAPAPDPALRREAEALVRELTGRTRQASAQALGALRHGKKPWNWRR
jgi:hypothetical protein